jgi:hypothetical protein
MPYDQTSPQFLARLKTARGFLDWLSEEANEPEHQQPATDDQQASPGPAPIRQRTTTVVDYTPPGGMATDPLTAKGEKIKSAMQSQYGPEKGESVFYASKNKGTIEGVDQGNPQERFAIAPDGDTIIDQQTGKSYSIDDLMHIMVSGGGSKDATVVGPAKVNVNPIDKPSAQWQSPQIKPPVITTRGNDDTMQGHALSEQAQQGWNVPRYPPQKYNELGDGEGGKALGRLLKYTSGDNVLTTRQLDPARVTQSRPVTMGKKR